MAKLSLDVKKILISEHLHDCITVYSELFIKVVLNGGHNILSEILVHVYLSALVFCSPYDLRVSQELYLLSQIVIGILESLSLLFQEHRLFLKLSYLV